jgi:hypothetical protein
MNSIIHYIKIYKVSTLSLPHFATLCHTLPHFAALRHSFQYLSTLCHNLPHFATICHNLKQFATICHNWSQYDILCQIAKFPNCETYIRAGKCVSKYWTFRLLKSSSITKDEHEDCQLTRTKFQAKKKKKKKRR